MIFSQGDTQMKSKLFARRVERLYVGYEGKKQPKGIWKVH